MCLKSAQCYYFHLSKVYKDEVPAFHGFHMNIQNRKITSNIYVIMKCIKLMNNLLHFNNA